MRTNILYPIRILLNKFSAFFRALIIVAIMVFSLSALEYFVLDIAPHAEYPPQFGWYFLVRIGVSCASAFWLVSTLTRNTAHFEQHHAFFDLAWRATFAGTALIIAFFVINIHLFHFLSKEDHLVETLSVVFLFFGATVLIATCCRSKNSIPSAGARLVTLVLALILFIVAMEEISWMQRMLGFETPPQLSANMQGEFNFHNLATNLAEMIYYLGAFVFLILLPLAGDKLKDILPNNWVYLIPAPGVALCAAPMAALNYDMFNIVPLQITVFATIFILMAFAKHYRAANNVIWLNFIWMAGAVIAVQVVFLIGGHRMLRVWEATEYKECLIAFGFAVYALQVFFGLGAYNKNTRQTKAI